MVGRFCKVFMCLAVGVYAAIVAIDNVVDYGVNYTYVRHVMSMDDTWPGTAARLRAITDPALWKVAYGLIIVGEAATAVLFLVAAAALWRRRVAEASLFQAAKRWVHLAATTGFLVWFVGFEMIGGEYFAMWQSPHWNGQEAAFRFYATLFLVLLYVNQTDGAANYEPG